MNTWLTVLLLCTLASSALTYRIASRGSINSIGRVNIDSWKNRWHKRSNLLDGPGGKGSDSEGPGFLKIKEAPPKLLEARQHGKTVLECSASGNPAPRITWLKDGKPLIQEFPMSYGDYGDFSVESLSETKSKISLDCVSEQDAGLYECVAHTSNQKTSVGTEVHVVSFEANDCTPRHLMNFDVSPPKIFQWMGTYLQVMGTDALLLCRAEGHHSTTWMGPDGRELMDPHKYKILDNGDLVVKDLSFEDMGMFTCLARNDNGQDMIQTFLYPLAPMKK